MPRRPSAAHRALPDHARDSWKLPGPRCAPKSGFNRYTLEQHLSPRSWPRARSPLAVCSWRYAAALLRGRFLSLNCASIGPLCTPEAAKTPTVNTNERIQLFSTFSTSRGSYTPKQPPTSARLVGGQFAPVQNLPQLTSSQGVSTISIIKLPVA